MNNVLTDQVILVTGGGRGLGAALCEVLAEAGAKVIVADRDADLATPVASRLTERGLDAWHVTVDIGDETEVQACLDSAIERYGHIDVVINNAAIDFTLSVDEMEIGQWDRVLTTNLRGPFLTTKLVVPHMRQRQTGQIVNIASTAAKRTWPNACAYHASKWGLLGFSHAMHAELRPYGIKVTAAVIGGMRTPFLLDRFPDIDQRNLQDPAAVARAIRDVLCLPPDSVIPEVAIMPMRETSWP